MVLQGRRGEAPSEWDSSKDAKDPAVLKHTLEEVELTRRTAAEQRVEGTPPLEDAKQRKAKVSNYCCLSLKSVLESTLQQQTAERIRRPVTRQQQVKGWKPVHEHQHKPHQQQKHQPQQHQNQE